MFGLFGRKSARRVVVQVVRASVCKLQVQMLKQRLALPAVGYSHAAITAITHSSHSYHTQQSPQSHAAIGRSTHLAL